MQQLDHPLIKTLPTPLELQKRLWAARQEVELTRRLLRLSERAEAYRNEILVHQQDDGND